jgi:hypothetical protein
VTAVIVGIAAFLLGRWVGFRLGHAKGRLAATREHAARMAELTRLWKASAGDSRPRAN